MECIVLFPPRSSFTSSFIANVLFFLAKSTLGNISRQRLIGFYDPSFIQSAKRDTARIFLNDLACRAATAAPPCVGGSQ
jgi:hypothetical protein